MKFKLFIFIVLLAALVSCIPNKSGATPIVPKATVTELPSLKHQLTYVMTFISRDSQYEGIFARDIKCLEMKKLCFGSPELLLKIPKQSDTTSLNPYGEITSYSWSPNGLKIAFSAFSIDGKIDIFTADWNGENLKNITMSPETERSPSWSTDNRLLYTVCSGRCHIIISNETGTDTTSFPFDSAVSFATWMPDGENILFIGADHKAVDQIYIMNVNGTNLNQITFTEENNMVPDASTDGNLIFFARTQTYIDNNFNYNIFSIEIDGKTENAVTTDTELLSFSPSIAPFGGLLAFEQGRGSYSVFISNLDGANIFQVTGEQEDVSIPEWRILGTP